MKRYLITLDSFSFRHVFLNVGFHFKKRVQVLIIKLFSASGDKLAELNLRVIGMVLARVSDPTVGQKTER